LTTAEIELAMRNGVPRRLPKMMIGFVVRRCAVELGRTPTASEFAQWANKHRGEEGEHGRIFGRSITEGEARLILAHQARLVSAKSASASEEYVEPEELSPRELAAREVISLDEARQRLARRGRSGQPRMNARSVRLRRRRP
jgi:hypothetical protein